MKRKNKTSHLKLSFLISRIFEQVKDGNLREKGQALVITAVAFLAMLAFAGLVTDAGTLYLNFTRLKRGFGLRCSGGCQPDPGFILTRSPTQGIDTGKRQRDAGFK